MRALKSSFFFLIQNSRHFEEFKNYNERGFYMNSSNLIYVVIIFLK
jgi:hypothetical protein